VYGKLSPSEAGGVLPPHLDFHHSYSHVYELSEKYSPEGVFSSFEHYNVEVRDRVKCISGVEGMYHSVSTSVGSFDKL